MTLRDRDRIKGNPVVQQIDRRAWSDIQQIGYDLIVRGSGEHVTSEPVMFGRAFSRPPAFSYSLTVNNPTEQLPRACIQGRNGGFNADGLGWTSNSSGNQVISDPFFEHQGLFVAELPSAVNIPSASDVIWDSVTPIKDNWTGSTTFPRAPNASNTWVQSEERRGKWVLSNDRSWNPPVGEMDSNWSAKYVLEVDGETNVLTPIEVYDSWIADLDTAATPADIGWIISSWMKGDFPVGYSVWDPEGYTSAQTPPTMTGWGGYASAWADAPGTLKVRAVNFHSQNYGNILNGDNDHETVPERDNEHLQSFTRHMNDLVVEFPVVANQWNDFDIDLAMTGRNRGWPNFPNGKTENFLNCFWRFEYSFIGTAGTSVYLDNLHMWQVMKNGRPQVITIGVKEWVIDEAGAYVGAYLWFKSGNTGAGRRTDT